MGGIVFDFLIISKNGRLLLHIIITVEVVMVVVLMLWNTLLYHNRWKVKALFPYHNF